MADASSMIQQAPLQDRDLLTRMSLYFEGLDQRLKQGQGWFIFNADTARMQRIAGYIDSRLRHDFPEVFSHSMLWRDFAISAYVNEIELGELAPASEHGEGSDAAKREYDLAKRVTEDTCERLQFSDLLVLIGLRPTSWHEATFLDRTIAERHRNRLATILLTQQMPQTLEAEFEGLDPSRTFWPRLFQRMYETSLVAL